MADNDFSLDKSNTPSNSEIGETPEPLFHMGQFKLLSDEELKALEVKPKPVEEPVVDSPRNVTQETPKEPETVVAEASSKTTEPPAYDGPSFFAPRESIAEQLKARADRLVASGSAENPPPTAALPTQDRPAPAIVRAARPRAAAVVQEPEIEEPPSKIVLILRNPFLSIGIFLVLSLVISAILGLPTLLVSDLLSEHLRLKSDIEFTLEMLGALIAYSNIVGHIERKKLSAVGFSHSGIYMQFITGAGIGALCIGLIFGGLMLNYNFAAGNTNPDPSLGVPLLVCLIIAVSEETIFRGCVLRLIEKKYGSLIGILVSCAFFTGLHFLHSLGASIPDYQKYLGPAMIGFGEGLAFAGAFIYTRNLWMPIGLHFAVLFLIGPILGFNSANAADAGNSLMSGTCTGDFWLTGGSFSPDASLPAALIFAIAGIILLIKARKIGNWIDPPKRQTTDESA